MPADDTLLGQNLVDVRNEGRRHAWRLPVVVDERVPPGIAAVVGPDGLEAVISFCTQDAQCGAEADAHFPDCPVEERLREEFAF